MVPLLGRKKSNVFLDLYHRSKVCPGKHPPSPNQLPPTLNPAFRVLLYSSQQNSRDTYLASHPGRQMLGLCSVVPKDDLAGNCVNNPSFLALTLCRFLLDLNI